MLALAVDRLPGGPEWEYELKLDGYRALAVKHASEVTLYSRNRKRFNRCYPMFASFPLVVTYRIR